MSCLLAISIGPVQDFIAAARKTRDLWYGSTLLSEVSQQVARLLQVEYGAVLIFPHPDAVEATGDESPAVANKILAILPRSDPSGIVSEIKKAAVDLLVQQYDDSLVGLGDARPYIDEEIASRQAKHFIEFYSAWVPYDGSPESYREARLNVERLLAGRKALRDFGKADGKANVPKSSLDPSRESVFKLETDDAKQTLGRRLSLAGRASHENGSFTLSEFLDGVSLVKRLGGAEAGQARYPSVVRVAADPYIRYLKSSKLEQLHRLNELAEEAARHGFIERLSKTGLHTAPYVDFPFDSQILFTDDPDIPDSDEDGKRIKDEIRNLVGDRAPAYYAILVADGDRMGAHLGTMQSPNEHQAFSRKLASFARDAGAIVREHQGVIVYSGGDDVLVFLPVDTAIDCAGRLRTAFRAACGADVTLSAGISVGFYREPLWLALDRARAAEAAAKGPRNALAVVWHTRSSGSDGQPVVLQWRDGSDDPLRQWQLWIDRFATDVIPTGAAYELRALAAELRPLFETRSDAGLGNDLVRHEVRRILKRKRLEGGNRSLSDEIIDEIGHQCSDPESLEGLVNLMIMARRFAAVLRPAGVEVGTS